mmetsp:Transcript_25261/g.49368  ORF Transcript_25261/g.49368 Transcript_25261/m.49368 type:complete len:95 (+) Transcript_25261:172-456(+)
MCPNVLKAERLQKTEQTSREREKERERVRTKRKESNKEADRESCHSVENLRKNKISVRGLPQAGERLRQCLAAQGCKAPSTAQEKRNRVEAHQS